MELFLAKNYTSILDEQIKNLVQSNYHGEKLLVILVGDNPSSLKYLAIKRKLCEQFGIHFDLHQFPADYPLDNLRREVEQLFNDPQVGGGIIQLPLPDNSLNDLLEVIPVSKDIDVLSPKARSQNRESPLVKAVLFFMEQTKMLNKINDVSLTVIGDGFIVGLPVYNHFKNKVRKCELIKNYQPGMSINSDLVILGTGVPELISAADLVPGTNVIDFGSYVKEGEIVGDLDMASGAEHLQSVSPSPGGMGPIVTRYLLITFLEGLFLPSFC